MNTKIILILACIFTLTLCSTVSASDTNNITSNDSNSILQSSGNINNTTNQTPDPIISGVVVDNSTGKGLANVTIKVLQNDTLVAQTQTHNDGSYSLNFANSNTNFTVIAGKLDYMPFSKIITVTRSSNPSDPNFYGTANFRLYTLLKYSGSASSYVLNVGALPQILLDIYAGKSSAWANSTSSDYASGGGTPLEVKLLTGSLLEGLLDVYSTGDEGSKIGGLLPSDNSGLLSSLQLLGLDVGLLSAMSNSSANPPQASGSGDVASLKVGIQLLLSLLSLNADLITANSSVTPNFNTGILVSSSNAGVADISLTLLGIPLLEIEALQSNATASVNGKPGGAIAKFTWSVADIKALGISILNDLTLNGQVNIGLLGLNILTLSLGSVEETTSADGTYAKASGDALRLQVLGLLGGGLINLVIGHAEADAQVPPGGLHVNTADVGITKTVNNTHPNYLDTITYTLTARNNGPDTATGVTIVDKLPSGLKFISSNSNYNPTTGTWTIGNLANGANAVLNIIAQIITSNTQITNIANITGNSYDPEPINDESNTTVTVDPASDLGITKTVNNTHPNYLDTITYTLTAHNYGPDTATGVTIVDKLPSGLKFISSNSNYNPTTGTWTIGNLANGANAVLNIIAQVVTSNTQITNIANITGINYDQNTTNNQSNTTITIDPASDLGITKTVDKTTANYLDKIYYTITVTNHGPDTANNIVVKDYFPDGLQWISDDSTGAYDHITGTWTIDSLLTGKSIILHIIAQITTSNTIITNIATVNNNTYDQNTTNNQDQTTTTVPLASDLSITKTVDNPTPKYLQNVTFTIKARNNGPDTATGVTIVDKLPSGLKFISSNSDYNPTTGTWTIGNLANGSEAILQIIAQIITSNTQITNIASINETNYDQNTTNNQSNTTITIDPASDLGITKTVDNPNPKYLQSVKFILTAHNYGPDNATGVKVTDKLPTGLKFISASGTGTYNSTTGIWTIGNLANGANAVLNIIAQVVTSNTQITNIANITGNNYDQKSSNDQSSATLNVGATSDLGITKTVNNTHPNYLNNVIFTLTAHNNGPNSATEVKVTDKLPTGLKFISASGTGTYNSTTGIWTIGNLANGANAMLKIIAQVTVSGTSLTNTASITGSEIDLNSTNNRANVTATVGAASDLGITKVADNTHPKYLQNVIFTLTAHNYGPNAATGVKVTDKLPAGLKFISASGTGTYNSTTGIWTIGNLANGANAVLKIIAQAVTPNTQITNTATITGAQYDVKSSNNKANATVNIGPAADLAVTLGVNNANPQYLQKITFTITAYNYGPMNTKNVTVTVKMPSGLKYISNDANGKYNYKTGIWTIGNLNKGAKLVIHIVEQVTVSNIKLTSTAIIKGTAILNTATSMNASSGEQNPDEDSNTDPDLSNNQANVTVAPYSIPETPVTNQSSYTNPISGKTIPMQKTGIPLAGTILSLLLVSLGMIRPKK